MHEIMLSKMTFVELNIANTDNEGSLLIMSKHKTSTA